MIKKIANLFKVLYTNKPDRVIFSSFWAHNLPTVFLHRVQRNPPNAAPHPQLKLNAIPFTVILPGFIISETGTIIAINSA